MPGEMTWNMAWWPALFPLRGGPWGFQLPDTSKTLRSLMGPTTWGLFSGWTWGLAQQNVVKGRGRQTWEVQPRARRLLLYWLQALNWE